MILILLLYYEYMKRCICCGEYKDLEEFYAHPQMADGHLNKCKGCCKKFSKNNPHSKINDKNRYRTNPKRYMNHTYYCIKQRCTNPNYGHRKYKGVTYLTKDDWDEWCEESYSTFISLYNNWQENGFRRRDAPSVDRIINEMGYTKDNLQWLTQSQNSKKR